MVHAHATTYAWAWTTDDSTDAFNVVNAIATTYAVDATSALEAERAINDAKDALQLRIGIESAKTDRSLSAAAMGQVDPTAQVCHLQHPLSPFR